MKIRNVNLNIGKCVVKMDLYCFFFIFDFIFVLFNEFVKFNVRE